MNITLNREQLVAAFRVGFLDRFAGKTVSVLFMDDTRAEGVLSIGTHGVYVADKPVYDESRFTLSFQFNGYELNTLRLLDAAKTDAEALKSFLEAYMTIEDQVHGAMVKRGFTRVVEAGRGATYQNMDDPRDYVTIGRWTSGDYGFQHNQKDSIVFPNRKSVISHINSTI